MKKIFFLSLLFIAYAHAQEKCLSGKVGNNHLIEQLQKAKSVSPIAKLISAKYGLDQKTEADSNCADCEKQKNKNQDLKNITKEKTFFKSECIEAAASIQTGSREISCPDQKIAKHQFCFTKSLVTYQNAALSEMYKCVKFTTSLPITPDAIFEMYTLESGFKPAYTNGGGTGLGQLTGIFIKDLHQKHRGRKILESIQNSKNNSCDAAKIILQQDLKKEPNLKNKCEFTQYGEGLERNILYTLAGMASSWQKDIEPLMKDFSKKNADHSLLAKAQAKALLNAYGPGGRAAARAAVRRLSKLSPENFIAAMDKPLMTSVNNNLTVYTSRMHKKQNIIAQKLSGQLKLSFKKEGSSACTE
jgi:hypothetical protein